MKKFFKECYYFLTSKIFLVNILVMLVLVVGLCFGTLEFLSRYTNHNESIEVPNLVKLTVDEAEKLLKSRQLEFVITDSICKDDRMSRGGLIRQQTPRPGSRVKESRKIYLEITKYGDCTIKLTHKHIIGQSLNFVRKRLTNTKLKVDDNYKYVKGEGKNTIKELLIDGNVVFSDDNLLKGGEALRNKTIEVKEGGLVQFVVYEGLDYGSKTVPNLVCKNYAAAELVIKGSQLNIGNLIIEPGVVDTGGAFIYKQVPEYGSNISTGTGINLWLRSAPVDCPEGTMWNDSTSTPN